MTLAKPDKYLVGISTIYYVVYLLLTVAGIIVFFGHVFLTLMGGDESAANLRPLFTRILSLEFILPLHVCSLLLEVGLLIFYLIHTIKNTKASDAIRIALGLGHIFLPFIAMPIYYYLYIWRENPPVWAGVQRGNVDQLTQNVT